MSNLMKTLTIGSGTYEICDATARETIDNVAASALPLTGGDMTGPINMNGQPISGLNPPTEDTQAANKGYVDTAANTAKSEANAYTDTAVRKAAPRNLLDNSDFRNPVNQRGKTSYTAAGYTIDRWISASVMPVNVSSNGITLDGTNGSIVLTQIIDGLDDGVYTFAAKVNGSISLRVYKKEGTTYTRLDATPNYTGGYLQMLTYSSRPAVQIRANSGYVVNLEWAALYEGEYTAETLPEYQPKGYGAELAECQRYYIKMGRVFTAGWVSGSAKVYYMPVSIPVGMRLVPTFKMA